MRKTLAVTAAAVLAASTIALDSGAAGATRGSAVRASGSGCSPLGRNIGYSANFGDDNIFKLDLTTNRVIETISGFSNPWGLELNRDGSLLYVASVFQPGDLDHNQIDVVDTCTNKIIKSIRTVGPGYLQVSPDRKWLYVPNLLTVGLQMIDTDTAEVKRTYGTLPLTQAGVSDDQKTLWLQALPNLLYTIDMRTGLPDGPPFDLQGILPMQMTMSQDGSTLAVADFADRVAMVDTRPGSPTYRTVTDTYQTGLGSQPGISAFSPDGRYLWVGGYSGQVSVLDLRNRTMTCWNLRANAFGTTVSADGKRVYVTSTPNGTVQVPGGGFGVLVATLFKLKTDVGGVIHVYDAQKVYDTLPFGAKANCSSTVESDGPELGTIPVGDMPIALATLDSAAHVGP